MLVADLELGESHVSGVRLPIQVSLSIMPPECTEALES
jgi:hypothetical protein